MAAVTPEKFQEMIESIARLMTANQSLSEQVTEMKKQNEDKEEVLRQKKAEWVTLNIEAGDTLIRLKAQREEVVKAGGTDDYLKETIVFREEGALDGLLDLMPEGATVEAAAGPGSRIKQEHVLNNVQTPEEPFRNTGREEKLDISFGTDCSGKALRRFMDKWKVVKHLNVAAKLTGWDQSEYRANKLKLALQGEAFDYVSFESTMPNKVWTDNDDEILVKLEDRYMKIHAIELNILEFEKSAQEPKEPLSEFLSRIQRLAVEAYDGDNETELERKLAWRFVTGVRSDSIRKKLMEYGWMKTRREAKPLEDLLKIAEIAKMTEEAVRVTGPDRPASVNVCCSHDDQMGDTVNVAKFERRKKQSSDSSKSGSSSKSYNEFYECWYCKQRHKGGWSACALRQQKEPDWRPKRSDHPRSQEKKDFR